VVAQLRNEGRRQRRTGDRLEGRVIRILNRATDTVVGTLQKSDREILRVMPDDSRLQHFIYVRQGETRLPKPPQTGDKVVVRLAPWENPAESPEGEIIEVLGPAQAPGVDMLSIIRKYDLPTEFPHDVAREAERVSETVPPSDLEGLLDLRQQPSITIDPDDARDFDDAIHVERLPQRGGEHTGWKLSVHIADVSHYVTPGSALDREAHQRGNSTYLVDRVLPMLPERLSNGICSLKPHVDRLAFSAFIEFTREGKIRSSRFARTVIRSAARLSYRQAHAILQGEKTMPPLPPAMQREEVRGQATLAEGPRLPVDPAIAERVNAAWELASLLRKLRYENGSLDLDFPEVKVWLDGDGKAVRLEKMDNDISHQLIEECMLAANEVVAREIKNQLVPAVYRIHEDPDPDRLNEYREYAAGYGIKAGDLSQRREVQKVLAAIKGAPEEYALKIQFLRSLKRAVYDTRPAGHYGLAKVNYTHFTSPIRRYADLCVHRALAAAIAQRKPGTGNAEGGRRVSHEAAGGKERGRGAKQATASAGAMSEIAAHISRTERVSADAEKDSVLLKKIEYFQRQLLLKKPDQFRGIIVDVRSYGVMVELPDILLSGLIPVSALPGDFYAFDPVRLTFTGRKTKRRFKVGDELQVITARVDAWKRQIDFAPAE
jgi:ribonuclease R